MPILKDRTLIKIKNKIMDGLKKEKLSVGETMQILTEAGKEIREYQSKINSERLKIRDNIPFK